ncbi:DUF11 domain-containing protein [Lysobacter capsici]|uniref:DUF7933 domain-containing protein n=1 Tax=Lysobacter capsici TaxID=435897 RepID=UPI001C006ED2|nr:DUF11 domain-containing protein [Lysobacter capsici]QWF16232.1 DUF11 domain-containing protein [Lysobacter capsici]
MSRSEANRRIGLPIIATVAAALSCMSAAQAQFKVSSTFRNNTEPGWTITGTNNAGINDSGILTGGYGAIPNNVNDANGSGWLRLSTNSNNQQGLALYTGGSFPSSQGVIVEFDYVNWGGNGADGTTFFLYDALGTMVGAQPGGSLGYCGGNGGYLGIGLDEFGNFSGSLPGVLGGCPANSSSPGSQAQRVVLRGPVTDNNRWLANAAVSGGIDTPSVTTRPAAEHMMVALLPNTPQPGYTVTVSIGVNGGTPTTVLSNVNFNYLAPANLRMGYAGSTGGLNNVHEVRNMSASVPADIGITKTVSAARVRRGQPVTYTVVVSNLDINPVVAGNQAPSIPGTDAPDITDTFPSQLTGTAWTCVASAGSTCPAPSGTGNIAVTGGYSLLPGGTLTYTVTGTVANNAACNATVTNTASALFSDTDRFGDINAANNTASANFAVDCINLAVDKTTAQTQFTAGGTGTYNIAVSNSGTIATTGALTVTDTLPAGLSVADGAVALSGANAANWACIAASNTLTCTSASAIAAAANSTFGFNVAVAFAATGPVVNTARVAGGGDANCPLATPCADPTPTSTPIVRPSVSLRISKTDGVGTFTPGGSATYIITACNQSGPDPANGATITDPLPAGVTLSGPWSCAGSGAVLGTCPVSGGAVGGNAVSVTGVVLPVGGCVSVNVPVSFSSNPADY